ncbi:hypothetical protein [Nocardia cyriacigeorgica]|uniref:hypothetical protein n=1 Tax=Nocardia cyriacigeorgica TaxID=135487 RepID=UPI00249312F3|nr:hypothetical protein [Nocardia cyriacigeorgica]BDT84674.1 hypothetical protein FMUAM8_04380 [Nocardia cyriacigeorgica]
MLEPNGPLPPEIYWRRRVFAIGVLVVALVLVIWLVVAVSRGGDSPGDTQAAANSSTETNKPAGQASTKKESAAESSQPSGSVTSSSARPVAAGQCSDQSLAVKVTVAQPTYRVGEQPVFGIVITNISADACTRDMGSGLQQVSVHTLDGQRRLWASTDCYPDGEPDVRTLQPGEQAAFTVTWTGATSQPECAGERVQVPAGAYNVVAQLGAIRSAPEPFNIA